MKFNDRLLSAPETWPSGGQGFIWPICELLKYAQIFILQHSVKLVNSDNSAFKNIDRCVIFWIGKIRQFDHVDYFLAIKSKKHKSGGFPL